MAKQGYPNFKIQIEISSILGVKNTNPFHAFNWLSPYMYFYVLRVMDQFSPI